MEFHDNDKVTGTDSSIVQFDQNFGKKVWNDKVTFGTGPVEKS